MVLTRSQNGDKERRGIQPVVQHAQRDQAGENSPSSAAEDTGNSGTVTTGTTATATDVTTKKSAPRSMSQRSSTASKKKKMMAELAAKEKVAATTAAQASAQAELLRIQRLNAEDDTDEEEEEEEEEDDLAPVRLDLWQKKNKEKQPSQEEPEEEKEEKNVQPTIDVSTLAAALSQVTRAHREPPKYIHELPFYNGNSAEWLSYKTAYEETCKYFTKNQNAARLRRSLKGLAKEAASCLLLGQADPDAVMEALQRRFGRPEALIHLELEKLKMVSRVTDNPRDLCIFAGKISNVMGTVEALKKTAYLHSPEMSRVVIEKLTPILKSKWYDYASKKNEEVPELKRLSAFLNEEADKCGAYALPEVIEEGKKFFKKKAERTFTTTSNNNNSSHKEKCPMCQQQHKLPDCNKYQALTVNERWETAKKNNICFRCLRSKHKRMLCKAPPCGKHGCIMKHHKLLHHDKPQQSATEEHSIASTPAPTVEVTSAAHLKDRRRAYLKIAPVTLQGPLASIDTYALLDKGSTVTLIDSSIAEVIGADGPLAPMWIQGVGTEMKHERSKEVSLKIRGRYAETEYTLEAARTVDRLSFTPETVQEEEIEFCDHLKEIKEEVIYERASPKILLGQDNWHLIVSREIRSGHRNQPVASHTLLGWVLHGCQSSLVNTVVFCGKLKHKEEPEIEDMIKEHFKLESLCIEPRRQREDPEVKAMEILEKTSRRLPNGRFETGLLWKNTEYQIPNNYNEAERRLHSLEKKLDENEDLKEKYEERMNNLFTSGYAEPAQTPPKQGKTWYLPHFPVINPAKPHKPPRLVHDAAARTAGVCLNDMLYSGPDLLQSLPGVIMKFREHPYAVSADIKEMFMRVQVREEDRDALRFLWRGNRREGRPEEYRMKSIIFGATSSPCTALYVKNKNAEEYEEEYPKAAAAIKKHHYMDDYLQSFETIEEAQQVVKEVDYVHKKAGFELDGWAANDERIIDHTEQKKRDSAKISLGNKETEKTLGLLWHVKEDKLGFNMNTLKIPQEGEMHLPTKRQALSVIMGLFDPLGLLSPITTPAKRIFQDSWKYKMEWDDKLPINLAERWHRWLKALRRVENLKIPRCYNYNRVLSYQLHTFVDASEEAYAAAVYWRIENEDGSVKVTLATAKSRVTPLKPISMPRLELQAALLGTRLAKTVSDEHEYTIDSKTYWSDSRTALTWIRGEPRTYKSFVAHRLAEIEDTTKKNEWRWIPTKENVADDATRTTPDDFDENHRWFQGPAFLRLPEEEWPQEKNVITARGTGEEREKCNVTQSVTKEKENGHLPQIERFSRWNRLVRATARVLQFVDLCRTKKNTVLTTRKRTKTNRQRDPDWRDLKKTVQPAQKKKEKCDDVCKYIDIPAQYLIKAEKLWIKASQKESFADEIRRIIKGNTPSAQDKLRELKVFIDDEGTARLSSRIAAVRGVDEETINPVVLEGKHSYARLYIRHIHEQLHHGGVETVVNEIRQRAWITRLRPTVKEVIKGCLLCRIRRNKPASPSTGNLPHIRLAHHARPFTFTGLDYFGPMDVTVGRHKEKRYGALFTCMTSRAIHIEVAHSLSADSAISALRRFVARRGVPKQIISDNGTNFKAANRELETAAREAMEKEAFNRRIEWKYMPPSAPFMGGAWERMVRAVKEALSVVLREKCPSDETLVTLMAEVENTVNSRPLTHVSVDPDEPEAITPNHILIGPNCHVPAPGLFEEKDVTARQQWRRAQVLADMFWRRWMKEYLPILQSRREPYSTGVSPSVGDVVVICDSNLPRNTWPKGVISAVYPGADGEVRVVDVTTGSGHTLRRPTKRVVVLPSGSQRGDGGRMCTTDTNVNI